MSTPLEVEMEVRRLHFAEHWPVGTISTQLGLHPDAVRRILRIVEKQGKPVPRPSMLEVYSEFLTETLKQHPSLRATRLFDMVKSRGYAGSVRTLRSYVRPLRPRPRREAYLRLEHLIGEQSQVDWAHVGKVPVPGGERPLWLFVMVLCWSRALWGEFVFDMSTSSLLRSLSRGATYFGGCTRQWLFDNPKSVVTAREGHVARFHPKLLEFAGEYFVSVRACGVRKANEKGRVERSIRYLRERFLAGRRINTIEQGNRELLVFLDEVAHARPHPTLQGRTVKDCLLEERTRLLALPQVTPETNSVEPVSVDKTAFVRFDTNLYSVPHACSEETLTLVADDLSVRFLRGQEEVARHGRCWGRRQRVEDLAHRHALLEWKRGAREMKGQDRLRSALPGVEILFARWVEAGRNLGSVTARTVALLERYGEALLAPAIEEVISRGMNDPSVLDVLCERLRRDAHQPVPLNVPLGNHVPDRDVIHQPLDAYDIPKRRRP